MVGNWELQDRYINYVWQNNYQGDVVKQEASIEETHSCKDRGNFKAAYECFSTIDSQRFLTNYYFVKAVAIKEVECWAEIIASISDSEFLAIAFESEKVECIMGEYFNSILAPVNLIFSEARILTWRFNPILFDQQFELDVHDMFPRYYLNETSARVEQNNWIDFWVKKYQENQKQK